MYLVNTQSDDSFLKTVYKAREILRETAPVKIGDRPEPLCSEDAIDVEILNNKLRFEKWYMNNLDANNEPTEATDAFMCFGTLDFGELFYLNKEGDGVEDFQKRGFKEQVRRRSPFFTSGAGQGR